MAIISSEKIHPKPVRINSSQIKHSCFEAFWFRITNNFFAEGEINPKVPKVQIISIGQLYSQNVQLLVINSIYSCSQM